MNAIQKHNELNILTKDPYKIPTIDDIKRIQELKEYEFSHMNNTHISSGIELVHIFPEFHRFLVNQYGEPQFPEFDLPLLIFSALSRYMGILLQDEKNDIAIMSIMNHLEYTYKTHSHDLGAYIGEFLELSDLYDLNTRKRFYTFLPGKLKEQFDTYFLYYLN